MTADEERIRLGATFDTAADLYERARPEYPPELFDHLIATAGLSKGDRVLEIGCGTGKATTGFVRAGLRVTCLEPGSELAAIARRKFGPEVEVVESGFEDWRASADQKFALVAAATSWHWVDPSLRLSLAAGVLRPEGHLAVWGAGHAFPPDGDPFFDEIQAVYDALGEGDPPDIAVPRPSPADEEAVRQELDSGPFQLIDARRFSWEVDYECEQYIDLLNTFSGHITMDPGKRDTLYGEIRRRLAERPDRTVRRGWGATLHIARLLGPAL